MSLEQIVIERWEKVYQEITHGFQSVYWSISPSVEFVNEAAKKSFFMVRPLRGRGVKAIKEK